MNTDKIGHSISDDSSLQALRRRAEEKVCLDKTPVPESLNLVDARRMLHEMQVHQIELEMQNEELRSTQHELETSRDSYFDLYDLAPVGYLTLSEQGLILKANLAAAAMFGMARRDLLKKPMSSFFLQKDQDIYHLHRNLILETDELQSWEMRMLRADGSPFWAKLRVTPAHNSEYGITLIDITERKEAEEERAAMILQQEGVNLLLQSLLKPAPLETKLAGITDGIVRYFEADFSRIWLIRPGDLCESACMHAEVTEGPHVCRHRDRCLHLLASSGRYTHIDGKVHRRVPFGCYKIGRIASGEEHKLLTNNVDNDPRIHDHKWAHKLGLVSFAGYQLRVPGGETIGVLALFSRRTILATEDAMLDGLSSAVALTVQQATAEDALRENTVFLNTLLNSLPLPVFYKDSNCSYIGFNKAYEEFFGNTRDQLLGKSVFDIASRELAEVYHAKDLELLRNQVTQVYESQVKDMLGVIHDVVFHKAPFMDSRGRIRGLIGAISDITERKQAEFKLNDALVVANRFRDAMDQLSGYAYMKDRNFCYTYANQPTLQFFGCSAEELVGKDDSRFFPPTAAKRLREVDTRVLAGEHTAEEIEIIDAKGERRVYWEVKTPIYADNDHKIIWGLCGISTDISERKLAEEAIANSNRLLQAVIDSVPMRVFWKDTELRYLGCNMAFAKDAGLENPDCMIGKDDHQLAWKEQAEIYRADDRYVMESSIPKLFYDEPQTTPEGNKIWLRTSKVPLRNEANEPTGILGIYEDITERKQAEIELKKNNAEIEQFIYTVSHDLRSPLVTVKTFLGFLENDMAGNDKDRVAQDLHFIHNAADKMKFLLDELLELSRVGRSTNLLDSVTFQELVAEALDTVAGQITAGKVHISESAANPILCGDRRRLLQIWQNLLENALKYMGDNAEPHIEIGVEQQHGETVFFVRDNGIGIAPAYHEKVFGIFEQLDHKSGGVGMGLTMIRHIVEIYGGRAWVESGGEGQGCCFRFTLPGAIVAVAGE